jgi:hypothetical protein
MMACCWAEQKAAKKDANLAGARAAQSVAYLGSYLAECSVSAMAVCWADWWAAQMATNSAVAKAGR